MDIKHAIGIIGYRRSDPAGRWHIGLLAPVLAAAVASYILLFPDSSMATVMLIALAVAITLWKPVLGMAAYLVVYPLVPGSESLNVMKVSMFALTVLLLAIWALNKAMQKRVFFTMPEYRWLYVFFIYTGFSLVLQGYNDFTAVDWARDIAPMLSLLLVPVMADHFREKKNRWLLYLFVIPLFLRTGQLILILLAYHGSPYGSLEVATSLRPTVLHPSLGVGLGVLAYLYKAPRRRWWMILSFMSLVVVFLTPGRTIWITAGTMLLMITAISSRRRVWSILSIAMLLALVLLMVTSAMDTESYLKSQGTRFQELREYQYDLSYQNRVEEMKQSGEVFLSSPIYGVGFGYQYHFWRPHIVGVGPGYLSTNFTHSDIMFVLSKGGVIGLALFALMLYGFGRKLQRLRRETPHGPQFMWATFSLLALMNSLIIGSSTPFYQTRFFLFAFAVLLAYSLSSSEDEGGAEKT
jgi:O-antigen ligase